MIDDIGLGAFLADILLWVSLAIVLTFAYFFTRKAGQWWLFPLFFLIGGIVSFWLELGSFIIFYFLVAILTFLLLKFWKGSRVIF